MNTSKSGTTLWCTFIQRKQNCHHSDLRNDIQSGHVPTILFHGLHDRICPFELAETMTAPAEAMPAGGEAMAVGGVAVSAGEEPTAGGIRGAALVRFENSGHALFYE